VPLRYEPTDGRPVLITGGAGYIGSHAALALLDRGVPVVIVDDLSTGDRRIVPPEAEFVEGRAGDAGLMSDLLRRHRIHDILHFAASIRTAESVANPALYQRNNVDETRALADAARASGARAFVLASTGSVYGAGPDRPFTEADAVEPMSPYGQTKLAAEAILGDLAAAGMGAGIVRCFNVAGADPAGRSGQVTAEPHHLIEIAVNALLDGHAQIRVFGSDYPTPDGTAIRDYVHVSDIVEAHLMVLAKARAEPGRVHLYNAGSGAGASVLEVVTVLAKVSGLPIQGLLSPRRPGDPPSVVADSSRIRAELGWEPRMPDIETIVRHALEWESRRRAMPTA